MAKLVRHLTSNEEIVGSNPAESISHFHLNLYALMAKLVRHLTSNEEIVGSNPAESNLRFFLHICLEYIYSGYIFFLSFFFIN